MDFGKLSEEHYAVPRCQQGLTALAVIEQRIAACCGVEVVRFGAACDYGLCCLFIRNSWLTYCYTNFLPDLKDLYISILRDPQELEVAPSIPQTPQVIPGKVHYHSRTSMHMASGAQTVFVHIRALGNVGYQFRRLGGLNRGMAVTSCLLDLCILLGERISFRRSEMTKEARPSRHQETAGAARIYWGC